MTLKTTSALALIVVLAVALGAAPLDTIAKSKGTTRSPSVPHAWVIFMENKDATAIMGSASAPYINSLITRYGYAANYYGVTHPSLPNYVASIAGDNFDIYDDWAGNRVSARNLADQLGAKRLTWKAYMEGLPYAGFNGDQYPNTALALYARKHNPFMLMRDVLSSSSRRHRVVPDTQLFTDLKRGNVPTLSYISPNLCDDMHGIQAPNSPCPEVESTLIKLGDTYLSRVVPAILHSPAWKGDSAIFIVWDESDSSYAGCCDDPKGDGGGKVPAIVIARQGPKHHRSATAYNHYSLLATLQTVWKLGCLAHTCDRAHVHPMTDLLGWKAGH